MPALLDLDEALAIFDRAVVPVRGTESCALADALHRVTASSVHAPYALPPFTNTGVDGYAYKHESGRTQYKLVGASFAGEPFSGVLKEGEAARIATGAVLPQGADTVAMQEICTVEATTMTLNEELEKGANLRHAGADIAKGAAAIPPGRILRPQDIALLGALGLRSVDVMRPLRIAVASTGQELLAQGQTLTPGRIIDTNGLMLAQMLRRPGIEVEILPAVPDQRDATETALADAAARFDMVITTGGVSVGDRDFVRDVLHDKGEVLFWKLAIRPGKPVLAGRIGQCIMLGLPGNPVSAFVTFFLMVVPVLARLRGGVASLPPGFSVTLSAPVSKPSNLRGFSRALWDGQGAKPYPDQSSNLFTSLTQANGLLDLPIGPERFEAGETVLFRPFSGLL